jgi:uncharacterized BrkB/YihY/UPF0761 family membrane protein
MLSTTSLRESPVGRRTDRLVERVRAIELLDRAYTRAAKTFVALFPLILVLAGMIAQEGEESLVAEGLIERLGLIGAGAVATRELIVIEHRGVYWLGALIVLFSAFSLSRRLGRAYNAIWQTAALRPAEQWRGLVWIGVQVVLLAAVSELRAVARDSGTVAALALVVVILGLWFGSEFLIQRLFTHGAVARRRLMLAAGLVTVGRLGIVIWGSLYLAPALSRQADSYGPIGVVFGLFTALFGSWLAILGGTLIAAVLTEPLDSVPGTGSTGGEPGPDIDRAQDSRA